MLESASASTCSCSCSTTWNNQSVNYEAGFACDGGPGARGVSTLSGSQGHAGVVKTACLGAWNKAVGIKGGQGLPQNTGAWCKYRDEN